MDPARLQAARVNAGLSQRQAAARARVARGVLHNAEHGLTVPHAESLARIARVYGVTLDSLFHAPEPHAGLNGHGPSRNQQPDRGQSGATRSPDPAPHGG